eukprot:2194514-Pleurochrysis_carterae.AAC.1
MNLWEVSWRLLRFPSARARGRSRTTEWEELLDRVRHGSCWRASSAAHSRPSERGEGRTREAEKVPEVAKEGAEVAKRMGKGKARMGRVWSGGRVKSE